MAKQNMNLEDQSVPEMLANISNMENEYRQMKFEHAVKGLPNPLELRILRKDIARIHTEIRSRELGEMSPEQLEMRSKLRVRRRRQK